MMNVEPVVLEGTFVRLEPLSPAHHMQLCEVGLKTDVLNERSRRAILRIGAREEGILRRHAITATGRVRDTVYYGITDEDWTGVRAELERKLARPPTPLRPAPPSSRG